MLFPLFSMTYSEYQITEVRNILIVLDYLFTIIPMFGWFV